MFAKLFAESGLSLDRLKALLEVGVAGSIVKAACGDPVRQSQYSRQIKELEDFFRTRLIEREGKGTRLTGNGKELARISRFFMLGLSNFQRGCLAEEQRFRIGASGTFVHQFLLPALARKSAREGNAICMTESACNEEIETGLHDLTFDFGIVTNALLSRPLQTRILGMWKLELWVPKGLGLNAAKANEAFHQQQLPLALARKELDGLGAIPSDYEACLTCDTFLDALTATSSQAFGSLLPNFLAPGRTSKSFIRVNVPEIDSLEFRFYLAWNPRLLRLNPHATRTRDWLGEALGEEMNE